MDWCSVYLAPQALSKYIYRSPPLMFPTTSVELGQKTARCESLRVLLHYVEWDRIVTLAVSKSGLRVTLLYLVFHVWVKCQSSHIVCFNNTIILNIIHVHNTFNLRDTEVFICRIFVLIKRDDGLSTII
jgi:hypothetical protein